MKKILFFSLLFLLYLIPNHVLAFNVVKPTSNFYVNDYANILSNETERYIMKYSVELANQTNAQIVVVTVPNLNGASLEEYATKLFREFGIGDKDEDNGLLLLLALEERQMRVEVGYGLEGILPDGKTGRFQDDYMIPYLSQNNFDEGILNGYKAFYRELANYYNITSNIDNPIQNESSSSFIFSILYIILFIIGISTPLGIFIVIIYILLKGKKVDGSVGHSRSGFSGSSSRGSSSRSSFSGRGGSSGGGGSSRRF